MDSLFAAAARALALGQPLAALDRIALRDDPPALALRGIAMAQLQEFDTATRLLKRALRSFDPREKTARARCTLALAEVALAAREPLPSESAMAQAIAYLAERGDDNNNAVHGRLIVVRGDLTFGRLSRAKAGLDALTRSEAMGRRDQAFYELSRAQLALRSVQGREARAALLRAREAAQEASLLPLVREVDAAIEKLSAPAAELCTEGQARLTSLEEVEALLNSDTVVIDACRRRISRKEVHVNLSRRPVLFALARALAASSPGFAARDALAREVFDASHPNDSHWARLRVEVGRLRRALKAIAVIETSSDGGYRWQADSVALLRAPVPGSAAELQALLADGERWSTSMLALASGTSQRSVQRALTDLQAEGRVYPIGRGRSQRWVAAPTVEFATALLLANPSPIG